MNKIFEDIRCDERLSDIIDIVLDMVFDSDENLEIALEDVMEGGRTDYETEPFAIDGTGGVYVLLNDSYVGYISTEGRAGIIARSVEDYFKICFGIKYGWCDIPAEGVFDNCENFFKRVEWHKENSMDGELESEELEYLNGFMERHNLNANLKTVYDIFKEGVTTQPEFIIEPTAEGYGHSDDLFGSGHKYVVDLLRQK